MLLDGTLSAAAVPQDFATVAGGFVTGTAAPSSVAPAGPETCHWQVVGLPVLVLFRLMVPRRGLPEKLTDWFTVAPGVPGVKLATTGVSLTVIVWLPVSLETPSLTWSCTR